MAKTHRDFGRALADPSEQRDRVRKKELRFWVGSSVVAHVGVVVLLAVAPAPVARPLPAVLTVNLVAGVPAPRPKASAPRPAPAKPEPAPRKAKPVATPEPVAKAKPAPTKKLLPKKATESKPKRVRPRELDFDEALAQLRDEMGEPEPTRTDAPPGADAPSDAPSAADAAETTDAQLAAWVSATIRHVRSVYVTPPEFLSQNLVTHLRVTLTAGGMVVGTPEVVRSSGNPFWDDNAVRALVRASPLPAPPTPGVWAFAFPSMEPR